MAEKRNTKQKQVIYSVIKELKCHPTAQQLHQILVERGYNIGASTVYRVLADAVDDGIIMNVFSFDKNEHLTAIRFRIIILSVPNVEESSTAMSHMILRSMSEADWRMRTLSFHPTILNMSASALNVRTSRNNTMLYNTIRIYIRLYKI